jgi:uncharacterized protein
MKQTLIITAFLFSMVDIFSQDIFFSVDTISIHSQILNEKRNVIIYRPLNLVKTDSVKFLYLLEGEYSNNISNKIHNRFKDSISNLIIVGIMNPERRRDMLYVNGADKFLEFITKELIPVVEKDYKTSLRILNGHSFCGSFTVYSLLNRPNYFNFFIATSPTPIMGLINTKDYQRIDSLSKSNIRFYFSFGSQDMGQVRKWALKLKNNLTGLHFNHIDWRFEILEGKNHGNSDVIALLHALNDLKR